MALDNFQGPLDLLLYLTQKGKLDIRAISTSQIAEQFLGYVRDNGTERLENVADWLVMAATLVWIKSRLLLPVKDKERKQAEDLIETLAEKLQRLEAMKSLVGRMGSGLILDVDWFGVRATSDGDDAVSRKGATMRRLLAAYAKEAKEIPPPPAPIRMPHRFVSIDEALRFLARQIGVDGLIPFLGTVPPLSFPDDRVYVRTGVCSAFVAALELAKRQRVLVESNDEGEISGVRVREGVSL